MVKVNLHCPEMMDVDEGGPAVQATDEAEPPPRACQSTRELYFAVARFLAGGPCQEAAEALIREISENEVREVVLLASFWDT